MLRAFRCLSMLVFESTIAMAQTAAPDSSAMQNMLLEVHQLRQDLQIIAATIQRVQIVMYRLQAESAAVDRVTQRLDSARNECNAMQSQRKMRISQIEQTEARRR